MEQPLDTNLRALAEMHASSTRNGHEAGAVTALEPSEPSRGAIRRLRLAFAARAAIGHPNLLPAWVIGEGDGRLLVASEPCPLRSLSEVLAAGPLEPAASARVLGGAASGVDALTRRALVARDLTPGRVLVHPVKGGVLMDLGIPPELLRQPLLEQDRDLAFRSPEELRRERVDVRSSVYSLGAILFTALTGFPPNAGTGSDIHSSHLPSRPSHRRSELSPEIDAVVARAMAADPAERYADAKEFARAATAAADPAPKVLPGEHTPNEHWPRQPSPKPARVPSKPKGRPTRSSPPSEKPPTPPRTQNDPQRRSAQVDETQIRPTARPAADRPQSRPVDKPPAPRPPEARRAPRANEKRRASRAAGTAQPPQNRPAVAPSKSRRAEVRRTVQSAKARPTPGPAEPHPAHRRADGLGAGLAAGIRRCAALIVALLVLAGAAGLRGHAWLRRITARVKNAAQEGARVGLEASRRGAHVVWAWFLRACRLAVALGRSAARLVGVGAALVCIAGRRAIAMLLRLKRSARSLVRGEGGRIDLFPRRGRTPVAGLVSSQLAAEREAGPILFGSVPTQGTARRLGSIKSVALSSFSDRKVVLPAVGAIVASALCGIALGHALEPKGGPSSITRSGLTVQLPPGWVQAHFDPGRPALSSAMAAAPSGETEAGFVVGELRPQAAAERMLERVQREDGGRTQVRLGAYYAWRYAGLRPRPHLAGTGYLLPITGGAVLMFCHASRDEARVRLAECERAASTLVVRGERPRRLSSVDPSRMRLIRVLAALRSSRSDGLRRLTAAQLAPGQVRAATSLERSHQRAARSLQRISRPGDASSLPSLTAALRAAADAYGRLARAATTRRRSAYREARHVVVREEEAVRRELRSAAAI